jgi:uncharacterized membrane protein
MAQAESPVTTALTACLFDTADGADNAVQRLMSEGELAPGVVDDAVTLRWDEGAARPCSWRRAELSSGNALGDGFWALVIGLTLRVPLLGAAVGGVAGARSGSLAEAGIDETFMNRLRDAVTPGRSAFLVLGARSAWGVLVGEILRPERPDSVATDISARQLAALHQVFST